MENSLHFTSVNVMREKLRHLLLLVLTTLFLLASPLASAGYAAVADAPKLTLVKPGSIDAIAELPDGGLIIGGAFTQIQGKEQSCIAKLNPDGTLDEDWDPQIRYRTTCVKALLRDGDYLYVGGGFAFVGGKMRLGICRLDLATGKLDPDWYPVAEGDHSYKGIYAMQPLPGGNEIFLGGFFSSLGKNIQSIVKVSTLTGDVDPDWDPGLASGSQVYAMALSGGNLYIGGYFTEIAGVSRNYIAKVSAAGTGALDMNWNPDADSTVSSLVLSATGDKLYAGGDFRQLGGVSRRGLARMNAAGTGQPDAWDPAPEGIPGFIASVRTLALTGNSLYVGGQFAVIGGQNRNSIARLSTVDATADSTWNPDSNKRVRVLLLSADGSRIHVGGEFFTTGGEHTLSFASLETASDNLVAGFTDLNIGEAGIVNALVRHANDLYFGGDFVRVNGQPQFFLGKIDTATGQLQHWGAGFDGSILALAVSADGSALYTGGDFTHIGLDVKNHLARLQASDASVVPAWNPSASGSVWTLLLNGNDLYVGGRFFNIGGVQHYLARLAADTGVLDSGWNPQASRGVYALALSGNDLYAGGVFSTMGGLPRNRLAKLDTTTAAVDAGWQADTNSTVRTLLVDGNALYVGGHFTQIGGVDRNRIARLNASNGAIDNQWNPDASKDVFSLALSSNGNDLYLGGWFSSIGGIRMPKIAKVTTSDATLDMDWDLDMSTGGTVSALVLGDTGLYAAGEFPRIGGKHTTLAHIVDGHLLTVTARASGQARYGVIDSTPEGIKCSPYTGITDCEHAMVEDDYVLTAASGDPQLTISQEWLSGCDSAGGTSATCGVTLDADKAVAVRLACEQFDMLPPEEPVTTNTTVRCREIKAVRGYEIGDGGRVRFEAQSSVELGPGFRVNSLADYFAISVQ